MRPPLAALAAFAAVIDLLGGRVGLRAFSGSGVSHEILLRLSPVVTVARNLVAVAGLFALAFALVDLLRAARFSGIARRLFIAVFAGLFLPSVVVATLFTRQATSKELVTLGIGAANVLAVLVGLTAIRVPSRSGMRVGLGLAVGACVTSFASLVFHLVPQAIGSAPLLASVAKGLAMAGELLFLGAPFAFALSTLPLTRTRRTFLALMAGAFTTIVALFFLEVAHAALRRGGYADVLYGALRFELLVDIVPALYSSLIASALAVGVAAALHTDSPSSQAGLGVLLFFCGGFGPEMPVLLLMRVLGATLLARAALGVHEDAPLGKWSRTLLDELDGSKPAAGGDEQPPAPVPIEAKDAEAPPVEPPSEAEPETKTEPTPEAEAASEVGPTTDAEPPSSESIGEDANPPTPSETSEPSEPH